MEVSPQADLREDFNAFNRELDVEGLCRAFLKRVRALKDAQGDRISH